MPVHACCRLTCSLTPGLLLPARAQANVRNYYMQFEESATQSAIDSKIMEFEARSRNAFQAQARAQPSLHPCSGPPSCMSLQPDNGPAVLCDGCLQSAWKLYQEHLITSHNL